MKYLLLFLAAPAAASFIIQCILCCKIKNGILRHGTLILPAALFVSGFITLMTQHGDIFSGLGVIEAVLLFTGGCGAAFGYGAAWIITLAVKNRRNKRD